MKRVMGVGGIFLKSRDKDRLCDWYRRHLGMDIQAWGGTTFPWNRRDGMTVWSVFPDQPEHFAPSTSPFMVNYIVEDLHALLEVLRAEGCQVDPRVEESEFGAFGWVMDPDGNRVELWQPPRS